MVEMVLTASDAAGHKTESEVTRFRLPERMFLKPLARALIEQRRHLIVKPEEQGQVAQMLEALLDTERKRVEEARETERQRVEEWKDVADRFATQVEKLAATQERRGWWPFRKRA